MSQISSEAQTPGIGTLVAAVARTAAQGGLGRYLQDFNWDLLKEYLRPMRLQRGHLLIAQGAQDRTLYFVESGDLKVDVRAPAGLIQLAILGPGSVVGECSFFSQLERNASVAAYSDCTVWKLSPEDFDRLAYNHPRVALALSQAFGAVLASRMVDVRKRIAVT